MWLLSFIQQLPAMPPKLLHPMVGHKWNPYILICSDFPISLQFLCYTFNLPAFSSDRWLWAKFIIFTCHTFILCSVCFDCWFCTYLDGFVLGLGSEARIEAMSFFSFLSNCFHRSYKSVMMFTISKTCNRKKIMSKKANAYTLNKSISLHKTLYTVLVDLSLFLWPTRTVIKPSSAGKVSNSFMFHV